MTEEKTFKEATVVYPIFERSVLLALKVAKIGAGCWNGYGGVQEPGETLRACAVRELFEESGLSAKPEDLEKIAVMDFHNQKSDGSTFVARVHFYSASSCTGEYHSSSEMTDPTLYPIDKLPLDNMMPADRIFVPLAFSGKKVIGSAQYTPFQKELIGAVLVREVTEFEEE